MTTVTVSRFRAIVTVFIISLRAVVSIKFRDIVTVSVRFWDMVSVSIGFRDMVCGRTCQVQG